MAACAPAPPTDRLRVSGHVEATEVHTAAEVGGRLLELRVAEGDRIEAGAIIARLDTEDIALQIARTRADRAAAVAQLRLLEAGSRAEDIRQARAQVDAADGGCRSHRCRGQSRAARPRSISGVAHGQRRIRQAARRCAGASGYGKGPSARGAGSRAVGSRSAGAVRSRHAAGRDSGGARTGRGRDAQIAVLEKSERDANVISPISGIVTQKLVDAGEIIARGTPLVVITDLDHAWANLFVPEPMVPRVAIGQAATVLTDAGGPGLEGKVTFISPRAEFTPRNVQTAEERSKLVYRIKVTVDNRAGVLKLGMPVDAELKLQ